MESSSIADVLGNVIPHQCPHCDNIVFTSGGSISFSYSETKRARAAKCKFFELFPEKQHNTDITWSSRCPTLVIYCGKGGHLDFCWMDSTTKLFDSAECPISASFIFTLKNSLASAHFRMRPLNSAPGSEKGFHRMRRWIHKCTEDHTDCKELRRNLCQQYPTRLIDVGNTHSKNIRICSTIHKSNVQYAALSYCWGGEQESKTVAARLEERCREFPLEELSRTIQDAVVTTRRLRLQYLWVDAICIIQDDAADKEREIAIMDQIYTGAFITIVAARAEKANDGFLQDRDVKQHYGTVCRVKYRQSSPDPGQLGSVLLSANRLDITYDDPIDKRGWTFQERYQSFRTLRFGSKQTVWECPHGSRVDGGENFIDKPSSECLYTGSVTNSTYPFQLNDVKNKGELEQVLGAWELLVVEYSRRTLNERTDKLPAFAAMAKSFASFLQLEPEQYLAGLWAFDICMQLQWRRLDGVLSDDWCNKRNGPTWSWVSLDGPVYYEHPRLKLGVDTLKMGKDECQICWKSPNFKYGEVQSARLTVIGFLRLSIWIEGNFMEPHNGRQDGIALPLKAYWDYNEERAPEVWCLEISTGTSGNGKTSFGILLAMSVGNVYKRLGYFEFYHNGFPTEPIITEHDIRGLPLNSNWFYNGIREDICIV
jgi:hypothetical protein